MTSFSEIALGIACPMANEGEDGPRFVSAALAQCVGFRSVRFFAVLDKATTDGSVELLRELEKQEPRLTVVWAPENRCVVDAYIRGYREALAARCDWILEIDAGFSHQPEDIPKLLARMAEGYDCVFGSRFIKGSKLTDISLKRYLVSRGGTFLTNLLLGRGLADMTSGFEIFSRSTLEMLLNRGIASRAHFFQTEIKVYCRKLRTAEVPIHYRAPSPRLGSSAVQESFRQLWRLVKLRRAGQL